MASPADEPAAPAAASGTKTKEEALDACAEQHYSLITCFKTCSLGSSFGGCCTEEHKAFWGCYTEARGTNETRIKSWLDGVFGADDDASRGKRQQAKLERRRQQQQGQQQQQQQEEQPGQWR